jgi:hypothetical protein
MNMRNFALLRIQNLLPSSQHISPQSEQNGNGVVFGIHPAQYTRFET